MPTKSKREAGAPSPVAARVRARITEIGLSESAISERLGWHRSVLSTILRRLDAGDSNLRGDTLQRLELALGKPAQWILTGVEPIGVRLADCPGWTEAAAVASERFGISAETIATIAEGRLPRAVRFVDPSLIRALSDAL